MNSKPISRTEIKACSETWIRTLSFFGINRGLSAMEELEITRALQSQGFEIVELALFGARHEEKTQSFDPGKHVSIRRVLGKDAQGQSRIDKFANLGAQKRTQIAGYQQKCRETEASYVPVDGAVSAQKLKEIREGLKK